MVHGRGPVKRLRDLVGRPPRPDEVVSWELEHHIAELVDRLVAEGLDRDDAEAAARERFGDPARYAPHMERIERWRVARTWVGGKWDGAQQSVSSVVRTARRRPAYALGVVLTLALGLGANATMYGIVDRLLVQPPKHVVEADELRRVFLMRPNPFAGDIRLRPMSQVTYPDYEDLKAHSAMAVAGYGCCGLAVVGTGDSAVRVRRMDATAEYFPLLGVHPHIGRFFSPEETAPGAPLSVVISYELWERAYGSDPDIVGRVIQVGDDRMPVIGVTPEGFTGIDLQTADVILPLPARFAGPAGEDVIRSRNSYWVKIVARLDRGVATEAAEAEATRLHLNGRREQIEQGRYPESASIALASLRGGRNEPGLSAESRVAAWLMGVSIIVLLIACANVANLIHARVTRQRHEMAVRLALGVSRRTLVSRTVLESTVLAVVGGVVALAILLRGGEVVRATLLPDVAFPDSAIGLRVLAFTAAVAVLAGIVSGIVPALQGTRIDLAPDLTESGRGHSGRGSRTRSLLTAAQAALSVILLVGAGLFVSSLLEIRGLDLGLDTDRIVIANLEFAGGYPDPSIAREAYPLAAERVALLPEVESVAVTTGAYGMGLVIQVNVPGIDSLPRFAEGGPYVEAVAPGFFETAGLSVVAGRVFLPTDRADSPPVAIVNETMARALWPGQEAVGQCVMIGSEPEGCTTVVGVVENAARASFREGAYMGYYLPMAQGPAIVGDGGNLEAPHYLYIRARSDAAATAAAVTPVLRDLRPDVRWADVRPLNDDLAREARSWTLGATMFIAFGLLAVTLAAIGLYAILAFDVAQRTRELGIRVALGAKRERLLRSVLAQGGRVAALGIVAGLAVTYAAAPLLRDLLFQVSPRDPGIFAAVAIVLAAVSLAASFLPGLRATRVDPVTALKSD